MASESGVLYVGVTGALFKRNWTHKQGLVKGFTQRYNVTKLVWYEAHSTARAAIMREKEIKKWRREKKVALIEAMNREWRDLTDTL